MLSLNLGPDRPMKLVPASGFPDRAHRYVCDNCGRDVTKRLGRGHAHAWPPVRPGRFNCACGKCYFNSDGCPFVPIRFGPGERLAKCRSIDYSRQVQAQ